MRFDLNNKTLAQLEEEVLELWRSKKVFERIQKKRKSQTPFRFFEGPPTANGRPGIHHILARAFKDAVLRYQTMRGKYVLRRAGWDTHGLPVEIEVEKELGIKNKPEIEKYGISEFNAKAKESVWKYKTEWEKLTERVGFWLDFNHPYVTYETDYIESVWWVIGEVEKRGLLEKGHRVVPWCPRCETSLSSHELAQPGAYKTTKDPSLYVKFPLVGEKNTYLLVWTTTPWTLPGNMAVAVNPNLTYTKFKSGDEFFWAYKMPELPVSTNEGQTRREVSATKETKKGHELLGKKYEPLFANKKITTPQLYSVLAGDFVSTEDGTGLVHIAPAFGEEDLKLWRAAHDGKRTEIITNVDGEGHMGDGLPGAGQFIKKADEAILQNLTERGLVYECTTLEHEYPFCWRCSTPLIYFARDSWFIKMSSLRDELVKENQTINWVPSHVKEGRFGEWLKDVKDWSLSRERYWGTPLPVWECTSCAAHQVVGSVDDLNKLGSAKNTFYAIRHGEADHILQGVTASWPETKNISHLTPRGREQVADSAKKLLSKKIDLIVCSPMTRAKETAEIIHQVTHAPVVYDERLVDINCGIFDGQSIANYRAFFKDVDNRLNAAPPGGESPAQVRARMAQALQSLQKEHASKRILIVGHDDPLRMLRASIKRLSEAKTLKQKSLKLGEIISLGRAYFPFNTKGEVDLHKPFIDEITLRCTACKKGEMRRVKEVMDVWLDSGCMPFAEWHYPFENQEQIEAGQHFPADYIVEGMDQTRGWFYTMLAVSVLLGRGAPYKNAISLGLVLDKNGQKMSKSKGNAVDPWEMIKKYGADTIRWFFFSVGDPGEPKKFNETELATVYRKVFLIVWNSFLFLKTYQAGEKTAPPNKVLDVWIQARASETEQKTRQAMDAFDLRAAVLAIEIFIDDLSRWYIRRSRRNLSVPVLTEALFTLSRLLAPFAPFFAEALFQGLKKIASGKKADILGATSIHEVNWPSSSVYNQKIISDMARLRAYAAQALALREKAGIKVRQPLRRLTIKSASPLDQELLEILKDEINVKEIVINENAQQDLDLDTQITEELKQEGVLRELVRAIQQLRAKANLKTSDKIIVLLKGEAIDQVLGLYRAEILKTVNAIDIISQKSGTWKAVADLVIDGQQISLGIKKG